MYPLVKRPVVRNSVRRVLGRIYYTNKRYLYWLFGGLKFARRSDEELKYEHFSHQTPLLRKLKDVEMYMQHNKVTNLKLAAAKINRATLRPGEILSYWKLIGKPSKRKGYLKGMVLRNGSVRAGTGGGLCQLSNLIYWMTIHTPLTVVERHRHGFDVFPDSDRTQPFGSGASCCYNFGDLMIKNDTGATFQLFVEVTQTHLRGCWRSDAPPDCRYEVYEKEHLIRQEYWGGYVRHNTIYRRQYDLNGELTDDEFVVENYAIMMYSPLLPEHE